MPAYYKRKLFFFTPPYFKRVSHMCDCFCQKNPSNWHNQNTLICINNTLYCVPNGYKLSTRLSINGITNNKLHVIWLWQNVLNKYRVAICNNCLQIAISFHDLMITIIFINYNQIEGEITNLSIYIMLCRMC